MPFREDGDAISTANIQAVGDDIRTYVNAIPAADVGPGALQPVHLPGSLDDVSTVFPSGLTAGFTRLGTAPASAFIRYYNGFITTPYNYQLFHTGLPTPPYGAPTAWAEGWRIPQNPGTTERPEIVTANTRLDTTGYTSLHLTGSVNIGQFYGDSYGDTGAGIYSLAYQVAIIVGLGWEDGAGNRHVFEKSIRAFGQKNKIQRGTVHHRITQADLSAGDGKMTKLFLVTAVAGYMSNYPYLVGAYDEQGEQSSGGYSIAGCHVSVLPCHAEVLS